MYRCDVCAYETPHSRNLRMHINSEKHSNNMLVAQGKLSFDAAPPMETLGKPVPEADPLRVAFDRQPQGVR